ASLALREEERSQEARRAVEPGSASQSPVSPKGSGLLAQRRRRLFADADLVSEVLTVLLRRVANRHLRSLRERSVESRLGGPNEPDLLAVAGGHENRVIRRLQPRDRSGDGRCLVAGGCQHEACGTQQREAKSGSFHGSPLTVTAAGEGPFPRPHLTGASDLPTIRRFFGRLWNGQTLDRRRTSFPARQRRQDECAGARRDAFGADR